jgi:hypothetical protein
VSIKIATNYTKSKRTYKNYITSKFQSTGDKVNNNIKRNPFSAVHLFPKDKIILVPDNT